MAFIIMFFACFFVMKLTAVKEEDGGGRVTTHFPCFFFQLVDTGCRCRLDFSPQFCRNIVNRMLLQSRRCMKVGRI